MSEEVNSRVLVGPQTAPVNQWANLAGGRSGEALTGMLHAPYYEAVKRGRVFIGSNAVTGLAIPIYSAKANALTLWNPTGSGVDLVLLAYYAGFYSTAGIAGSIGYFRVTPAGSDIGTGAPIITATQTSPMNAYLNGGYASVAKFSPAVNTVTDTPTIIQTAALSISTLTVATAVAPFQMVDKIEGRIVVPPNCAVQVCGTTAIAIVANQSLVWEEVPV